ncbi:PREDICTED: dual oxidase maturation factor 1-like [Lepidothrix coronata]|uniref:Dual oxidase maturation factor 1-like n=1 Tax=Lepidothrix coronata TaxID=321398 RepID=A0A6J0HCQ2_9PASS|nr:PREDICTED: dual oxidase maturation factor 1-like [Lepidothrix coronata]
MTLWNGSYPFYPGANARFPFDTTRAVIITVFLSMLATFIIILPGIRGRGRLFWFLRLVMGLFVGAVVLTIQFTRDWETGWVSLGAIGPLNRLAFCTWLISILLFSMSILLHGGYMLLLTAALILFSLLFFFTARNTPKCPIWFGPVSLKTDYGESFWLTLVTGLLCLLLGLGVIILNSMEPEKLKLIFNLDKKKGAEEVWDKPCLLAEPSCSVQDVWMVPPAELSEVTATQL